MDNNTNELENVLVEATIRLDIEMFKEFAVNVKSLNSPKSYFIEDLEIIFKKFIKFGDTHLDTSIGFCGKCSKHCHGYLFVGNKSKNYFNFLIDIEDNDIKEIKECPDFKLHDEVSELNKRIYIHAHTAYNDPRGEDYLPF